MNLTKLDELDERRMPGDPWILLCMGSARD